jgi:hypothetical protein
MNDPEQAGERGKNTKVIETFTRHGKPGKTPEGMSADFILPEGLEEIKEKGKGEKDLQYYMIAGSNSVKRARETGKAYSEGVNETEAIEIINKEGKDGTKLSEFGVYAMSDLDPFKDAAKILKPILDEGKKLIEEQKLTNQELEGWAIAKFLKVPDEKFKEQDVPTPREVAARMAHRLSSGVKMSDKIFKDLEMKVNNFTHSPNPECLLKYVIKNNGKSGLDDIAEIGGTFKPGENVDFIIERDGQGNLKPIKINFRGKEYDFDMDEFNKLIEEYNEKKQQEKKQ